MKSWSLYLLEPSGPGKVCNGIALPFYVECVVCRQIVWLVVSYVPDVFMASDCEVSASLSYVCLVASFACRTND
jgi:hypothetical protein